MSRRRGPLESSGPPRLLLQLASLDAFTRRASAADLPPSLRLERRSAAAALATIALGLPRALLAPRKVTACLGAGTASRRAASTPIVAAPLQASACASSVARAVGLL
eukprot:scaffold2017_cov387-Prasinococcus_capsulatus_cf.AAC.8